MGRLNRVGVVVALLAALMAIALVSSFVACGGKAQASAARRCVDRWNSNLKRFGRDRLKIPERISSYGVHVGTLKGSCVVVASRHDAVLVFATGEEPPRSGSDYVYIGSGKGQIGQSLRVPNARFDSALKLTLKQPSSGPGRR